MGTTLLIIFVLAGLVIEAGVYLGLVFGYQKASRNGAIVLVGVLGATASSLLFSVFGVPAILFFITTLFRMVNQGRVALGRMPKAELKARYGRASLTLAVLTVGFAVGALSEMRLPSLEILLVFSMIGAAILLLTTLFHSIRYRSRKVEPVRLEKLPTVSICVPARNETQDLPECVETLLSTTYPKLEILVLDDCSHDKTPTIIKEYAHQGVRFIRGEEPSEDWLAKNQAMDKLFDQSTGDIVIFTGVDVRFSPDTVLRLVEQMEAGLRMVSILPKRTEAKELSVFIQPLRYWWELSVPRWFAGRPPILSTCWAIYRKDLIKLGEFDSVRRSVQPEAHFVKHQRKSYRFIMSGNRLGLTSVKPPREQYDTALRVRYPQVKRRPEVVLGTVLIEALLFMTPLLGVFFGLLQDRPSILLLALVSMGMLVLTNTLISALTVSRTWLVGLVSLPFLLLIEWYVLVRSMLAYEFGKVIWKERNICLPMFKVEKSLPEL